MLQIIGAALMVYNIYNDILLGLDLTTELFREMKRQSRKNIKIIERRQNQYGDAKTEA